MKNKLIKLCVQCGKVKDGKHPYWCSKCDKERIEQISNKINETKKEYFMATEE